jgi:predicted nuclease of restriction endonuclease-like (RecB) superfamily
MKHEIASINQEEYGSLLQQAVEQIRTARIVVAKYINNATQSVYWNLGKLLFEKQLSEGYGSGVVNQLSVDLKTEFPDMGLSPRNMWDMKRFYERYYSADTKLRRTVAVLPWRHNILLLNKIQSLEAVEFYANEVFKDNYNLGFLGITTPVKELELEKRLTEKIKNFVLELGKGFSFIGNQHRLEYNGKEYFVDMLFFHRGLRSLVAIELKIGGFKAEYIGKMNLYLGLLDKLEKGENENQSIGIILCADKDHLDVEIALQDVNKPIGVAEYQLLPKDQLERLIVKEIKEANQ